MSIGSGLRMGLFATILAVAGPAFAADTSSDNDATEGDPARGLKIAQDVCARCHAIGLKDKSPLAKAPPFRELGERYPPEDLAEALAEGIVTGHPEMPQVELDPEDVGNFIAYLIKLQADAKEP